MQTAKIFTNGRSQAVRLPKEYRMEGKDVFISSLDGVILLIPRKTPWAGFTASLKRFTGDFMEDREQPALEQRAF
jgi:antitoxin VapB